MAISNLAILRMSENEIETVSEIETISGLSGWGIENYKKELFREDAFLFVAKISGRITGFVSARLITSAIEIFNIAVLPEYRKQGIGAKLFERIADCAKKNEIQVCWLEVRKSNAAALNFYEKLGFKIVGQRKNYYTNPTEDAILLEFKLGN